MRRIARIGGFIAALTGLSACASAPPTTFDLSAAPIAHASGLRAQLGVREPTTSLDLDSQRIVVRTGPSSLAYLSGAQWSDRLPDLVRTRLVQTFQNAGMAQSVGQSGTAVAANYQLELDIRAFELDVEALRAKVDIAARIVSVASGRAIAAKIIKTEAPASGTGGQEAAAALNAALSAAMVQIVAFARART